jgi:KTSC domain
VLYHKRRGECVLGRTIFDFHEGGVCLAGDFFKKRRKEFKILSFCPLIVSTKKGDMMINNMVLSREIEWIGYEHKRNMLQIEFIVGAIYQYENVPETVYQEFLTAPSYGRFFESNIKNKYQARKVR